MLKSKNSIIQILAFILVGLFSVSSAKGSERIWRQANNQANYVGIEDFDKSDNPEGLVLNHPYNFDPKKFTDMLLSIRYNKGYIIKRDIKDQQVFFDTDLVEKKFAPKIVEAFKKVTPNQVVVFSIVQKDPYFIIRNDTLNIVRAFVAQDGLHLSFIKTNAKLFGDYKAHTTGNSLISSSKGLRVTLEPQAGQKLALNNNSEVVLDLNYDFAALVDKKAAEEEEREKAEKEEKKRKKLRKQEEKEAKENSKNSPDVQTSAVKTEEKKTEEKSSKSTRESRSSSPTNSSSGKLSPIDRLTELKQLKEKGLIYDKEYEEKRKEILNQL